MVQKTSYKFIILIILCFSILNVELALGFNPTNTNSPIKTPYNQDNFVTTNNTIKDTFQIGHYPTKIFFNIDNNYVYVLSEREHSIYVFNSGADVVGNTIPIGVSSTQLTYDHSNHCLYASNSNGNTIPIVNTTTNSLLGTINTGNYTKDTGVFYNSYNNLLYIESVAHNDLLAYNLTSKKMLTVIPITEGFSESSISMDLHNNLYIPNYNNTITVVNSENNTVVKTLSLSGKPLMTVYDTWTGFIYITDSNNTISVYDPVSNAVISHIQVDAKPVSIVYDQPDDTIFEVNNITGTLGVINCTTNTLQGKLSIGSDPIALTYDSNNSALYIIQSSTNLVVQVDIPTLLQSLQNPLQSQNVITTVSQIIVLVLLLIVIIGIIVSGFYYSERKSSNKNIPDLSLSNIDDLFKKKVLMQYIYGRLTTILHKISQLPEEMSAKTLLITSPTINEATEGDKDQYTRLGTHGQNLIKEMNGLSLMVLLECADSYPRPLTITYLAKNLNKPKSTIKSQIDKLMLLEYVNTPDTLLADPQYLDRRYKNLQMTKNGKDFLKALKLEIEGSGILTKNIIN